MSQIFPTLPEATAGAATVLNYIDNSFDSVLTPEKTGELKRLLNEFLIKTYEYRDGVFSQIINKIDRM